MSRSNGLQRVTRAAIWSAIILGLGHAAVSVYWLFDTALLDTVGGAIEEWARRGGPVVTVVLLLVIAAKLAAVAIGVAATKRRSLVVRLGAWATALVLTGYGAVYTVTAFLVLSGTLTRPPDVSERAVLWHAWIWDPWFALWAAPARPSTPIRCQPTEGTPSHRPGSIRLLGCDQQSRRGLPPEIGHRLRAAPSNPACNPARAIHRCPRGAAAHRQGVGDIPGPRDAHRESRGLVDHHDRAARHGAARGPRRAQIAGAVLSVEECSHSTADDGNGAGQSSGPGHLRHVGRPRAVDDAAVPSTCRPNRLHPPFRLRFPDTRGGASTWPIAGSVPGPDRSGSAARASTPTPGRLGTRRAPPRGELSGDSASVRRPRNGHWASR